MKKFILYTGLIVLLLGCANEPTPVPPTETVEVVEVAPSPNAHPPITMVPTFTAVPTLPPPATPPLAPALATEQPDTPVPFEDVIVDLRYSIPSIGLDRRLQGTKANRITFVDLSTGIGVEYGNQGGVLLELRQALVGTELAELPDDCDSCVFIEYDLSLDNVSGSGWLQDSILLASLENFMTIALGVHFPTDTIVGLHRSASPFAPAHTIALTADGRLWRWLATDIEVAEPVTQTVESRQLTTNLNDLIIGSLNESYVARCSGSPVEALFLDDGAESMTVSLVCPEFSLPSVLLPLYLQLDDLADPLLDEVSLPRPPAAFPLEALVDYRRYDGRRLTIFQDGTVIAIDTDAVTYTGTLTTTQVVNLTTSLLESGELQPGLSTYEIEPTATITPGLPTPEPEIASFLVLRGPDGLHDGKWTGQTVTLALVDLNELLEELLGSTIRDEIDAIQTPESTTTPVPEPTVTPTP